MAMEDTLFICYFPIETPISSGFFHRFPQQMASPHPKLPPEEDPEPVEASVGDHGHDTLMNHGGYAASLGGAPATSWSFMFILPSGYLT